MDEMWQRHKGFIVQVVLGGVLFLVAYFIMQSRYGDANDPEKIRDRNAAKKSELEKRLGDLRAPSAESIAAQRGEAQKTEDLKWALASRVASTVARDEKLKDAERVVAYVNENIDFILQSINQPESGLKELYKSLPQACLSRIRDMSRTAMIGKAAQEGKEVDETMGLAAYPDEEIPQALHGLAIVVDVLGRCLAKRGIEKVVAIRVAARSTFPENNGVAFMRAVGVHFELIGDPADVAEILRSFNKVERAGQRMIVLESIEYIVPLSPDEDTVKASVNVAGLRYEAHKQAEGN